MATISGTSNFIRDFSRSTPEPWLSRTGARHCKVGTRDRVDGEPFPWEKTELAEDLKAALA